MSVISIQSQVVYGHVGNSAAVFPLQLAGINVAPVPTTLLSNNPRYPTLHGKALDPALVADLLLGAEERGLTASARAIMSGYLGAAENGATIAAFVARARAVNPGLLYVCDPVCGDTEPGFYVKEPVREAFRTALAPIADILTPNQFELEFLAGRPAQSVPALIAAARSLAAATVIVSGVVLDSTAEGTIETFAVTAEAAWRVVTPKLPARYSGTGDLMTALFVANLLRGNPTPDALSLAISGMFAVLTQTVARDSMELEIVRTGPALLAPGRIFAAEPV